MYLNKKKIDIYVFYIYKMYVSISVWVWLDECILMKERTERKIAKNKKERKVASEWTWGVSEIPPQSTVFRFLDVPTHGPQLDTTWYFDRCRNRCALHWTWRDRTAVLSCWVPTVKGAVDYWFDVDGKTSLGFYWNVHWIMPTIIEKKTAPLASAQWSFRRYRKPWAHADTAWK